MKLDGRRPTWRRDLRGCATKNLPATRKSPATPLCHSMIRILRDDDHDEDYGRYDDDYEIYDEEDDKDQGSEERQPRNRSQAPSATQSRPWVTK